jgi:probable rRNA maturation factor
MKNHFFLRVSLNASVRLSLYQTRQLHSWLKRASLTTEYLVKHDVLPKGKPKGFELSLLLCGDHKIKQLNQQFRSKPNVTDVLSFPFHENLRNQSVLTNEILLGDLAICHQQVIRQSKEFSLTYEAEFIHLFFHGFLHLLGYDHELSEKEQELMQKWETVAVKRYSSLKSRGL